ncbi:MAG: hypothetical protein A2898_03630 [Candidatus Kerfeldbacteria bacterium RIFCSPLOWO2_01_FULL_48_11]|uniref:Type 4 fimbrial biogenesis protein PilX N-terminal domain-containing protein n=1 Tax=Candidatus Kerfeldbacteria bacterium RIFCSPLOWO2_01_FULL_48_11 TaxID=1798543 RepID=A0A1G2B8K7_9BACT|nr:MAG: hypothetical protein UY34_C0013G0034 [Parcubacteria group bacterium GW2011_GWA2_48_9]KKW15218.1 MAG: hypothetical protein UY52_C0019G0002 [Parcubacteria group bacterium GW2011_GWC2_49_9]OGY84600.1 MAG: hypothetical protein A2898_03630 [Candidatus Kerfeldbacteria bacterium RIFCSPLOWO2_01_FULL_48_11]
MLRNIFNNHEGAVAVITVLSVSVFALITMTAMSVLALDELHMNTSEIQSEKTFYAAEAGLNEAVYRLITNPVPQSFIMDFESIETNISTSANPTNPYQRIIRSSATDTTGKVRTMQIVANTSSFAGGFDYAVQSGQGGIEILNNSEVLGDIYSNGNIFGGTGAAIQARVDGNVWVARGDALGNGPSQEGFDTDIAVGNSTANADAGQSFIPADSRALKSVSLHLRRTGNLPDDVNLLVVKDDGGTPGTEILMNQEIKKTDVPNSFSWLNVVFDIGPLVEAGQTYWIVLDTSAVDAGKYIQWKMNTNQASYADGQATRKNDSTGVWTSLSGDFAFRTQLGAGDTFVRQVEVDGDVHAHSVIKSIITSKAYYQVIDAITEVSGSPCLNPSCFPGEPDPDPKPFPIQDTHITNWKDDAVAGGEHIGDMTISGSVSLGPIKISGNLFLDGSSHINVTGNIWVTGNIVFVNPGSSVSLDGSFGPLSGVIVADGKIDINNNTAIDGSGDPTSFLLILSTNYSINPASPAINASNNSDAVIFYAKNGMVRLYNGSDLNGTSGYYIRLEERSTITYDPNLAAFTIPAGGGEDVGVALGSWEEL